jgi:hypothetical protein
MIDRGFDGSFVVDLLSLVHLADPALLKLLLCMNLKYAIRIP